MRQFLVICLLSFFVCTSCTIEQTYTFNSDFSGEFIQRIDYSMAQGLMQMGEDGETPGEEVELTMLDDSTMTAIREEMGEIEGLRLLALKDEDSQISVHLAFDNLEALNQAQEGNAESSEDNQSYLRFSKDGNSLYIHFETQNPGLGENEDGEPALNPEGSSEMFGMIQYHYQFNFANQIQSVSGTPAEVGDDQTSVRVELTLKDAVADDFVNVLKIDFR
ncbi:MAG: hypothetical protein EA392_01580 [Cryomorphaceae bacterium]|nr:MAG: hypothetical protein EA392_01580 [Cryomorphaceae bacterium]